MSDPPIGFTIESIMLLDPLHRLWLAKVPEGGFVVVVRLEWCSCHPKYRVIRMAVTSVAAPCREHCVNRAQHSETFLLTLNSSAATL